MTSVRVGRGFLRLWIVVSVLWMAVVVTQVAEGPVALWLKVTDGWLAQREQAAIEKEARGNGPIPFSFSGLDRRVRGEEAEKALLVLGQVLIIPPAILLLLGLAIGWIVRGFRSS